MSSSLPVSWPQAKETLPSSSLDIAGGLKESRSVRNDTVHARLNPLRCFPSPPSPAEDDDELDEEEDDEDDDTTLLWAILRGRYADAGVTPTRPTVRGEMWLCFRQTLKVGATEAGLRRWGDPTHEIFSCRQQDWPVGWSSCPKECNMTRGLLSVDCLKLSLFGA